MMWEKNLKVLEKEYPELAEKVRADSGDDLDYKIENTKNGSKTIKVATEDTDNHYIYLHSRYNPEQEAERMIDNIELEEFTNVVIMGFGLGYHILELFERITDKKIRLIILEIDVIILKEALKRFDFTKLFNSEQVEVKIVDTKFLEQELTCYLEKKGNLIFEKLEFLSLSAISEYNKEKYELAKSEVDYLIGQSRRNKATVNYFKNVWKKNFLKNLEIIIKNPSFLELEEALPDKPAIIVGAGPSLNKNIHLLKEAKGKALIIAVDAALAPVLNNEIIPDMVITTDGGDITKKFYEGYYEVDTYNKKLADVVLAAPPQIQPEILNNWPGKILITPDEIKGGARENYLRWIEDNSEYKGRLPSGGSVSNFAFTLAYFLEADPIIFVGQDLAFSNNKTHAEGCYYDETVEENKKNNPDRNWVYFEVEDINGNKVTTRSDYYSYLRWFNRSFKYLNKKDPDKTFIDATEGGANIDETAIMSLKQTIKQYCNEEINFKENILDKINNYNYNVDPEFITELEEVINDIERIETLSSTALNLIDQLLDNLDASNINKINKKLDKINKKINDLRTNIKFFESEFYDIYFNKNYLDIETSSNGKILSEMFDFYNKLLKGSKETKSILKRKLQNLDIKVG